MDFRFSDEEEAFRKELIEFIKKEVPPEKAVDRDTWEETEEEFRFALTFEKKLLAKGWFCMQWPKEYGGKSASPLMQLVYQEEMYYRGAPAATYMATNIVAPAIMIHGSEEHKKKYLPGIARVETLWAQGFSEPNAGSDLASLQTTAVADGDDYVVNGQKTWSTGGLHADWIWLLARTDQEAPKHRGISCFAVDAKTPGVTVRPLINMMGFGHFVEIYFDNVRVPKENLVGEKNKGWYQAMTTLNFERSGVNRVAANKRVVEMLINYARETKVDGRPLVQDPLVRHKLAQMVLELEVGRMLCYRVSWLQSKGGVPTWEASVSRAFGCELGQRTGRAAMEILGLAGQITKGSKWAPLKGAIERRYLGSIGYTIAAGTSEIQRNIIADRGLGMAKG